MKKFTLVLLLSSFFGFSQWTQKGSNILGTHLFGTVVACNADGTAIAVGTPYATKQYLGNPTANRGEVKVYQYVGGSWVQKGTTIDCENNSYGATLYSGFGRSIVLSDSGNRLAIASDNNVTTYYYNGSDWVSNFAALPLSANYSQDSNKVSLAMSNDGLKIVVGYSNESIYGDQLGRVVVCELNTTTNTWSQIGNTIASAFTADWFGASVSCNQDATRVVVGAPYHNSQTGRAKVFDHNTTTNTWDAVANVVNGDATADFFGFSVSMSDSGTSFVVGAPDYDNAPNTDTGEVKVFERLSPIAPWTQKGSALFPNGNQNNVGFGTGVSMAANGDKIAVSLPNFSDTNLPFNNGLANAGRVKIYNYTASDWVFTSNINGEIASENLGDSISLSSDGTTIAVGSPAYKITGGSAVTGDGVARVFQSGGLSVNEIEIISKINLYPNPSNGKSTVDLGEFFENVKVSISNIEGKMVYKNQYFQTNQIKFDLNLQSGLYFVGISTEKANKTIKMAIE